MVVSEWGTIIVSRKQAKRQTNRKTDRQTNRQTDKQTDRQTDRQTEPTSNKHGVHKVCAKFGSLCHSTADNCCCSRSKHKMKEPVRVQIGGKSRECEVLVTNEEVTVGSKGKGVT